MLVLMVSSKAVTRFFYSFFFCVFTGKDSGCVSIELGDPSTVDISKLKVMSVRNGPSKFYFRRVSEDIKASQREVEAFLEKRCPPSSFTCTFLRFSVKWLFCGQN